MKKNLLVFLITTFAFTGAHAQMTGGGSGSSSPKTAVVKPNNAKWGALVIGLSSPMGRFAANDGSLPFEEAVGATPGIYVGYDGVSYFSSTIEGPVKIGLTYGFNTSLNMVAWDSWGLGAGDYTPFVFTGLNIGAMGSYEIIDGLEADAFLRLGVRASIGATGYWYDNAYSSLDWNSPGIGFGTEFGFNVRYEFLLATLRFNPGSLSYDYYVSLSDTSEDITYKLPISTVQLGIGFVLPKKIK
ncbi:MAG: hypothetical protein RIE86_04815 [Imperialibacter sp.]|uniref:hypothetical protein n=1 Tax=Imperialibacter sp. TaxID=2038411 RepID=UPI0032EFA3CF